MNQQALLAAASLLVLSLAGCVGGGRGGSSLSERVDRHDQQIQSLMGQVGQVEQVLPGQAEMWSQMQTMRQDVNSLQGKTEDMQRQLSGDSGGEMAQLRDRVARLEAVVRQMASQLAINVDSLGVTESAPGGASLPGAPSGGAVVSPGVPPAGTSAPGGATPTVDTATALYNAGIKSFDERKYKDAIVSFKDFAGAYPKHKLAANAHFWEGESYFQLKDYPRAALAYQEVIANFPGNPKMQSAMLKQGIALYNVGKKDAARERLNDLVKRYPNSPEATRAKDFLDKNK